MRILKVVIASLVLMIFGMSGVYAQATSTPSEQKPDTSITAKKLTKVYLAEVVDAADFTDFSPADLSNAQTVLLDVEDTGAGDIKIETTLLFPNPQFKRPLKIGDKVLLQSEGDINANSKIAIVSLYRQNNLLVWSFILIGLFILVSGFRSNIKYFQIFVITMISGALTILFYHQNTYVTFIGILLWQTVATLLFAYRIFRKKGPAIIVAACVLGNEILAIALVFIMKSINLFDTTFFEFFFTSNYDAREVMIYVFALLVVYPISIVFAEQIISEGIKKLVSESNILKVNLIKHVSRVALRNLNAIFLTFFGMFFAISVCVIALASREGVVLYAANNSTLSQILSLGFLIVFNLLIFVPLVSFVAGIWLGRVESHKLITDRNHKHLDL